MDAAVVIERHVERATFADEPVTVTAYGDGRVVRELGGPNKRGGKTYWTTVFPQGTWAPTSLPVSLYIGLPKSRDLGDAEDAEVEVAARSWNHVSCSAFRAHVVGTTTIGPGDDGTSGVYFMDASWPATFTPGAIATTVVHVDAQSHIYDADVYVNGQDHVFSRDGHGSTVDFRSIATHELGHVLGLGESTDPIATMYQAYPPGVAWRSLESDDVAGVCTLYPGAGDLLGCEASACPSGFSCVARECESAGDQRMLCSPCEPSNLAGCEGSGDKARCVALDAGYACGRPCVTNDDCGAHFSCVATTQAGDFQCVPDDDCASAANPCQTVAECNDPGDASWICAASPQSGDANGEGACLGPIAIDAGDASADASADGGVVVKPMGGCSCDAAGSRGDLGAAALVALGLALGQRQRRNGAQRGTRAAYSRYSGSSAARTCSSQRTRSH